LEPARCSCPRGGLAHLEAVNADRLFGHAAELGFYFLFALFPTLFLRQFDSRSGGSIGRTSLRRLLDYLALVIPLQPSRRAQTFNETTVASSTGKVTLGLVAAVWSASVGISAIQDTLNIVYKIEDSRSYFIARLHAIGLTVVLTIIISLGLACLLGGDFIAALARSTSMFIFWPRPQLSRRECWAGSWRPLFSTYPSPSSTIGLRIRRKRRWHWLTPGGALGLIGWLLASLSLRVYLHFFNNYSVTYGSLGAVIILLTWFYITGLMLLLGAEINSEIEPPLLKCA